MNEARKLFGTDGIRSRAGEWPMTPDLVLRVGMAVAAHFGRHGRVIVGKDTRRSGYLFEHALSAGLCAMGADVLLVGPMPTPAIAHLAQDMRADAGVVISASHNPFGDNGIKIFAHDGFKLPDEVESELEGLIAPGVLDHRLATGDGIGRAARIDDAVGRYISHLKHAFPTELDLDGLRIVVDCAHGAAYKIAPTVLAELGATVIRSGVTPDGTNINDGVGALHPEAMCGLVRAHGADLGIALDGDADRVVFCDAGGQVVDGDAILALCGIDLQRRGALRGDAVVATVMSNMGLERCLDRHRIQLLRTPVGDRYVVETMRARGLGLGGEQSGHLVFLDHSTTGDGTLAALQVLAIMVRSGASLADLAAVMTRYPQVSRKVEVARKPPVEVLARTRRAIVEAEERLGREGRVLVRYSGTEPVLRVMLEGPDGAVIGALADEIALAAATEIAGMAGDRGIA